MKKLFIYISAAVFSLYLIGAGIWSASQAHRREYAGLRVVVTDSARVQYLTSSEITKSIQKHIPLKYGMPLSQADADTIESFLRRNRLIAEVECYKTPSGLLRVDVAQCVPILRVFGTDGTYFVDEHGKTIPDMLPIAVYVPVATGNITTSFACEELYPFALFLQKNDFWRAQIEQICVNAKGEVELIPRVGEHRILLGKISDYKEKLDNLRCFYEQALSVCGWNKYKIINLKYKNQVVATRR